jgi:hypothetical protein
VIEGSCHCGAVCFTYPQRPDWLSSCNCSICRRLKPLWAYAKAGEISLRTAANTTTAYVHGDKTLAMHSCKTCGCTTHWIALNGDESARMAVNFRMREPDEIVGIRVRKFDGEDSWEFLDQEQ